MNTTEDRLKFNSLVLNMVIDSSKKESKENPESPCLEGNK